MTSIVPPKLGTDPIKGWQYYAIHLASSYVLKEFFLISNYRRCLEAAESRKDEVGKWAQEMRGQDYHELYTHAFIGMWAAFEAGVEDAVAAVVRNDRPAAVSVIQKFKKGLYSEESWPWDFHVCTEIAQKLDQKSKDISKNGGADLFERVRTTFGWLDVFVDENEEISEGLAEASLMRNIIVHRNGQIDAGDIQAMPHLAPWVGRVMPIDHAKFEYYLRAINGCLISLMKGMASSRHASPSK